MHGSDNSNMVWLENVLPTFQSKYRNVEQLLSTSHFLTVSLRFSQREFPKE